MQRYAKKIYTYLSAHDIVFGGRFHCDYRRTAHNAGPQPNATGEEDII